MSISTSTVSPPGDQSSVTVPRTHTTFGAIAVLTALGVVYGDIGTSPLYAFKSAMGAMGDHWTTTDVLGVLSLIFWSITLIVSVKYVLFVLRADNQGDGGILALLNLIDPWGRGGGKRRPILAAAGLFGCTLLIGDGTITPAISVLSAIEGTKTVFPALGTEIILVVTSIILAALFVIQRHGTGAIGKIFGPVMLVFFCSIAALGVPAIISQPAVLAALLPTFAVTFVITHGLVAFAVIGAVFLCLTGGEAMYADLGHCGRGPITNAWFLVVCPAVLLNYFGQGALIIGDHGALADPFFNLVPHALRLPMIGLSTVATVIASQALISGLFSLTRQAIQMGFAPRLRIVQTERTEIGQIYVPGVNWALMAGCLGLVWGFGSSDAMASAYGVAVAMTMLTTTVLLCTLMRTAWHWSLPAVIGFGIVFVSIDLVFTVSNMMKVIDGGWVPLMIAVVCFLLMRTYAKGSESMRRRLDERAIPVPVMETRLNANLVERTSPITQVFLTRSVEGLPPVLCDFATKTRSIADLAVILHFETARVPFLHRKGNVSVAYFANGFWRIHATYGYMQTPNVQAAIEEGRLLGVPIGHADEDCIVIIGNETVTRRKTDSCLNPFEAFAFGFMIRNSARASQFFKLPKERVLEIGLPIEI
jgi:KUP system potassium uptake protein